MSSVPVGVLISGRGSNLKALIESTQAPGYPATIALVISNKADAAGLDYAKAANIPTLVINHKDYVDRASFDAAMTKTLEEAGVKIVCLAGFMRLLSVEFVQHWLGRMINIHPSLLPAFKGAHAHRDALAAGVTITGCSVHFVTEEMDAGPIIIQGAVAVHADDDESTLGARVLKAEHIAYPRALAWLAEGKVSMDVAQQKTRAEPGLQRAFFID